MITIKIPYDASLFNSLDIMGGVNIDPRSECSIIITVDENTYTVSVFAGKTEVYKNGYYIVKNYISLFAQ